MTTVGKPKRALSPVATPAITLLQSDALKQFDADDVTVNTRLAMDELEDVFCSPTAKVKLTTAKTTARSCGRTLAPVPMTSFSVFEDEPSPGCEKVLELSFKVHNR